MLQKIKEMDAKIEAMSSHESRLKKIDQNIASFEKEIVRIREEGNIDFERICSKEEYREVIA